MKKYWLFLLQLIDWKNSGNTKKDIIHSLLYVGRAYLILVVAGLFAQRYLIYHPTSSWVTKPETFGAKVVSYTTKDGVTLTSWYCAPKGKKPVFAMFHGNAWNISQRGPKLGFFCKQGYGFLLAGYRGYGGNPGSATEDGLYTDARTAMQWLMSDQKIDESRIVIYGESLGTGVSTQMAMEHKKIKALALEAPLTSIPDMAIKLMPWMYPFKSFVADTYNNLARAPYLPMPVIVFHGDDDRLIPVWQGKAVFAALGDIPKKLVIIKNGRHNDLASYGMLHGIQKFVEERK